MGKFQQNNGVCRYHRIAVAALLFILSAATPVFAVRILPDSLHKKLGVGEELAVDIVLNTEGEYVNAVEGKITFSPHLLTWKEVRDGNSIVNFWVERPHLLADPCLMVCEIVFSGITPGGWVGADGHIVTFLFQTEGLGEGRIDVGDVNVFGNDGVATSIPVPPSAFFFSVSREGGIGPTPHRMEDRVPPESFEPIVAQDPDLFGGKFFLVFAAEDKGFGILRYDIYESSRKKINIHEDDWKITESPFVLKDQSLKSYIYVRAVDRAGNERLAVLSPRRKSIWYEDVLIFGILIIVLFTLVYGIKRYEKRTWR